MLDVERVHAQINVLHSEFLGNSNPSALALEDELYRSGLDSLSLFDFVLSLEQKFGIKISDEDFSYDRLRTVGDVITVLRRSPAAAGVTQ